MGQCFFSIIEMVLLIGSQDCLVFTPSEWVVTSAMSMVSRVGSYKLGLTNPLTNSFNSLCLMLNPKL